MRGKNLIGMALFFLLTILLISLSHSAFAVGTCITSTNVSNASLTNTSHISVTANTQLFIDWNATGNNHFVMMVNSQGWFLNGPRWDRNDSYIPYLGTPGTGCPCIYKRAGNISGNYTVFQARNGNNDIWFYQPNGSGMVNVTNLNLTSDGSGAGPSTSPLLISEFPNPGQHTFMKSGGSPTFVAHRFNGSDWLRNDSLANHTDSGLGRFATAYFFNLTGASRHNIVAVDESEFLRVMEWNGTKWNNVTDTGDQFGATVNVINPIQKVFGSSFVAYTSISTVSNTAQNLTNLSQISGNISAGSTTVNPSVVSQGDAFNITGQIGSACGLYEANLIRYNGTAEVNISSVSIGQDATNLSFNFSGLGTNICNRTLIYRIGFKDKTQNYTETSNVSVTSYPVLYNHTATSGTELTPACTSGTNVTITTNKTGTFDFTINMSALILSGNRTCPYGADNIDRIENRNTTRGCDALVFGANMTASQSITIDIFEAVSPLGVSNIPVAVGAAGLATLIIVYAVTRTRRK